MFFKVGSLPLAGAVIDQIEVPKIGATITMTS